MRFIGIIVIFYGVFSGFLNADTPINTDKILKSNQAVVFNAKTNTISYILEITSSGKIIKKFLSNDDKQRLMKTLNLGMDSNQNLSVFQNSESKNIDKYPDSHIKEWDKSKIIYEQIVDKIYILR